MKKAAFLDSGTFGNNKDLSPLKALPLEWHIYETTSAQEAPQHLESIEIVVVNKVLMTKELMNGLPHLKLICQASTGIDNIDLAAAKERGIIVCNVVGYSTATVTEMTILMILSLGKSFIPYIEDVKKGHWQKHFLFCFLDHPISQVKGKTLGILGYGNLGKEVARIATALGMKILIVEKESGNPPNSMPLAEVLKLSDYFTIHTPLTPKTRNIIGKNELALMKPSAFIINNSRGGIINEEALVEALKKRQIAGAALDVLTKEPPPHDHPLLDPSVPNLILTPHIAWASKEARETILTTTAESIQSYLKGELPRSALR